LCLDSSEIKKGPAGNTDRREYCELRQVGGKPDRTFEKGRCHDAGPEKKLMELEPRDREVVILKDRSTAEAIRKYRKSWEISVTNVGFILFIRQSRNWQKDLKSAV